MSYDYPDVYMQAEKFELSIVGELDNPFAHYNFDMLVVWQHEDGRLFYATDSGCSCPSPFEDYHSIDSLTEITDESWEAFEAAVKEHCVWKRELEYYADERKWASFDADKTQLLAKVAKLLRRRPVNDDPPSPLQGSRQPLEL